MMQVVMIMGGLGLVVGIGLAIAAKVFYVYVDPLILQVEEELPGANCGGCGLPGCSANAEAIVAGKASPDSCVAADADTAVAIASIMGVPIEAKEPDIARPGCTYGVAGAETKFDYAGIHECRAAALIYGGTKVCRIGCLGFGSCEKACPFDAITMSLQGLPVVDEKRCTGCGTCERVCPKDIIVLSSITRRMIKEYTTADCTTPCQRACPAGIDICEYIRQIDLGDYHRAVQVIKERNPFPTVIGRICPRPCEEECRRQYVDEPVAINYLKRFAADYEKFQSDRIQPFKAPDTGRQVAVVGGGVEGLSAAFFTARLGHTTLLYEAGEQLGGLLRKAIARERLPMDILDWDIQGVLDMGVEAETGKMLGRDMSVDSLLADGSEAVLLATGGWDSRLARGGANRTEHPIPAAFLLLDAMRTTADADFAIHVGEKAVIAGGGAQVLTAARRLKDLGAKQVTVMFREPATDDALMGLDQNAAPAEGIEYRFSSGIVRLHGAGNQLNGIDVVDLVTGDTQFFPADTLFFAAGRFPELIFTRPPAAPETDENEAEDVTDKWQAVAPRKPPALKDDIGLLAQGEAMTDYSAAIKAIGAGRRSAASIHQLIYGLDPELPPHVLTPASDIQNVDHVEQVAESHRQIMPVSAPAETAAGAELEKGFDEERARSEAARCLQCGLICYQHTAEKDHKVGEAVS